MSLLLISLPWLLNELLWSINKLKQELWCTIWLLYNTADSKYHDTLKVTKSKG